MKCRILITSIMLIICSTAYAQKDVPVCSDPEYSHFDFWLGDWNVYDTLGKLVGINQIEKLENGCLIRETWKSTGDHTGRSFNYFNPGDSSWHQLWLDNSGLILELKGQLVGGRMVMYSDYLPGKDKDPYANRITWTPRPDGSVVQRWDFIDENGKVLRLAFMGIYKPMSTESD